MNFRKAPFTKLVFASIITMSLASCNSDDTDTTTPVSTEVPAVYKKIYGATSITSDGTYITFKTKNLPDHKSPYYATSNALYEAYTGTTFGGNTFNKNPNTISEISATVKIPLNPKVDATYCHIFGGNWYRSEWRGTFQPICRSKQSGIDQ